MSAPINGGACPDCGRTMSVREGTEQGICNDCLGGPLELPPPEVLARAAQLRLPYVGEGADGCRRSAQIDREEADGLDRVHDAERILELLSSALRWEAQAEQHDRAAALD